MSAGRRRRRSRHRPSMPAYKIDWVFGQGVTFDDHRPITSQSDHRPWSRVLGRLTPVPSTPGPPSSTPMCTVPSDVLARRSAPPMSWSSRSAAARPLPAVSCAIVDRARADVPSDVGVVEAEHRDVLRDLAAGPRPGPPGHRRRARRRWRTRPSPTGARGLCAHRPRARPRRSCWPARAPQVPRAARRPSRRAATTWLRVPTGPQNTTRPVTQRDAGAAPARRPPSTSSARTAPACPSPTDASTTTVGRSLGQTPARAARRR